MSDSLWPHESQHARPPCPSPTPGVHSNSGPSSQWCYLIISSSVASSPCVFSLFLSAGSFPMNWLFASGGQSIGASASASVLPMNIQGWFPLGLTGLISLQYKGLSRVFSNTTVYLFIFLLYNIVLVLPYISINPPRVYTCSSSWTPLPPPSPYQSSGSSQCTSPKHPVSCIEPGLAIHFLYDIIHVSMPFSQIFPPSPSPTESKRLFYTSVSLLLSRIQGCHYSLSKFHIYALIYCIRLFLSGLLHSV